MRSRRKKTLISWLVSLFVITGIVIGFTYWWVDSSEMPVNLPFKPQTILEEPSIAEVEPILESWDSIVVYEPAPVMEFIPEPEVTEVIEDMEEIQLTSKFDDLLNIGTLEEYVLAHPELNAEASWDYLFIDKATTNNESIGIKTVKNDDVIAFDNFDGLMIVGSTVTGNKDLAEGETANNSLVKIAFVKPGSLQLEIPEKQSIWETATMYANRTKSIFVVTASDYTYNETYKCGRITGYLKRNGDTMRKAIETPKLIGINDFGELNFGTEEVKSGIEGKKVLIQNSTVVEGLDTTKKGARSAIGKLADGTIMIVTIDGNVDGATEAELAEVLTRYEATDATMMAGNNRVTMYFNGRLINTLTSAKGDGLRLPSAWVIKSGYVGNADSEQQDSESITQLNIE